MLYDNTSPYFLSTVQRDIGPKASSFNLRFYLRVRSLQLVEHITILKMIKARISSMLYYSEVFGSVQS